MASFGNFGNLMSSPNYLDQRKYLDNRAMQIGSSIGQIAGGLSTVWDKEKAQKVRDDFMKAKQLQHQADTFQFDEDEYRRELEQANQVQQLDSNPYGQSMEQDLVEFGQSMEEPLDEFGQSMEVADPTFEVEETSVAQPVEVTPEMLEAERERRYNALFEGDITREEYDRLRNIYKPNMKQSEEYFRLSQLLRPYASEAADKLEDKAYEQSQFEAKLLDDQMRAKQEGPYKNLVRIENYISSRQTGIQQLLQRRQTIDPNDTASLKAIDGNIEQLATEINNAQREQANVSEGSELSNLYEFEAQQQETEEVEPEATIKEPIELTGNSLKDTQAVSKALREGKITQDEANLYNIDIKNEKALKQQKAAPKIKANSDWQTLIRGNSYKTAKKNLTEWKNDRTYLNKMLGKKLSQAERGQLAFKIARVVTGPGVLTENDINQTKGQTVIDDALTKIGLGGFRKGTDYEEKKVKESIQAALGNTSVGQTEVDILNDMIGEQYNAVHPRFRKKGFSLKDFLGSKPKRNPKKDPKKDTEKVWNYNPKTGKFE